MATGRCNSSSVSLCHSGAREARVPEDFSDALTGHANPNVGRQYGNKIGKRDASDFLALLKGEIDRIEFDVP